MSPLPRILAVLLAVLPSVAFADALPIRWSALHPPEQVSTPGKPPGAAEAAQGLVLTSAFNGKTVELTGYVLPVDRQDDLVYEFMLVPWAGACSHTPPPPPNQLVHVFPAHPFRIAETYDTVAISGVLEPGLEKTQLFILDGVRVLQSGYLMGNAAVTGIAEVRDPQLGPRTPWSFLNK